MRVLVVDDEPDVVFLVRTFVETSGYEVVSAANGEEALVRLGEGGVDVVITDLMMPVMDGRELISRIRSDARTAAIPVIVVSASSAIAEVGADVTIRKPFRSDQVLRALRDLTGGAS